MAEVIRYEADATSSFNQYIRFLIVVPLQVSKLIERNAIAATKLTEPGEGVERIHEIRWYLYHQKLTGKKKCNSRVWTRRDERFIRYKLGLEGRPRRRVNTYLKLKGSEEEARKLFQSAFHEVDTLLRPKLDQCRELWESLVSVAKSSECSNVQEELFYDIDQQLASATADLMPYSKPPQTQEINHDNSNISSAEFAYVYREINIVNESRKSFCLVSWTEIANETNKEFELKGKQAFSPSNICYRIKTIGHELPRCESVMPIKTRKNTRKPKKPTRIFAAEYLKKRRQK